MTITTVLFYSCLVLAFLFLFLREIQSKGKTRKNMEGNGIVFSGMHKKMLKFFLTPVYFNRG